MTKKKSVSTIVPIKYDERGEVSEIEEQMFNEKANSGHADLWLRDQTAKSMIAWLVDWGYVEIINKEDGSCTIPSEYLKTGLGKEYEKEYSAKWEIKRR